MTTKPPTDPRTNQLFHVGGNGFAVEHISAKDINPSTSNVSVHQNKPSVLNVSHPQNKPKA